MVASYRFSIGTNATGAPVTGSFPRADPAEYPAIGSAIVPAYSSGESCSGTGTMSGRSSMG